MLPAMKDSQVIHDENDDEGDVDDDDDGDVDAIIIEVKCDCHPFCIILRKLMR